jgi:hypothetical protein
MIITFMAATSKLDRAVQQNPGTDAAEKRR